MGVLRRFWAADPGASAAARHRAPPVLGLRVAHVLALAVSVSISALSIRFLTNTALPLSPPQIDWKQWANMDSNQVTHELSGREKSEVEAYRVVTTSVDDYLRLLPLDATMRRYDFFPPLVQRRCIATCG